jgi:polysaccharide biosynthesis/export protein
MRHWFFALILVFCSLGAAGAADYLIGDGDQLQISVWGVPELSGPVRVRPDGKITLPAAGDVAATGLTPPQLSAKLGQVLGDFVKKPIVTVTVAEITNNKVYVAGGGGPAAVIQLPGRTTLFKFLCSLGNLEKADLRHAYLMRGGEKLAVNLHELYVGGQFAKDLELQPEDVIFIPTNELSKVYVVGAVKQPMYIPFRDGMKVLDAILEAGGFNEYAKENAVVITRADATKVRVKVKDLMQGKENAQNVALQPGDYVTVEEGLF